MPFAFIIVGPGRVPLPLNSHFNFLAVDDAKKHAAQESRSPNVFEEKKFLIGRLWLSSLRVVARLRRQGSASCRDLLHHLCLEL